MVVKTSKWNTGDFGFLFLAVSSTVVELITEWESIEVSSLYHEGV